MADDELDLLRGVYGALRPGLAPEARALLDQDGAEGGEWCIRVNGRKSPLGMKSPERVTRALLTQTGAEMNEHHSRAAGGARRRRCSNRLAVRPPLPPLRSPTTGLR